ncbi:MAG: envelope fusion protein [Bacteroidota bacterium]
MVHFKQQLLTLREELQTRKEIIKQFFKSRSRLQERGLIDGLGKVSQFLFGTATQSDVDHLFKQVHNLDNYNTIQKERLKVHSKVLNATVRNVEALQAATNRLNKVSDLTRQAIAELTSDQKEIIKGLQLFEATTQLHFLVNDLVSDQNRFMNGIRSMTNGQYSSDIISDETLLRILQQLNEKTPGLIIPAKREFLGIHKELIEVIPLTSKQSLRFAIFVPLNSRPLQAFEIYEIHSLPTPLATNKKNICSK